jgi:hypothetical protein
LIDGFNQNNGLTAHGPDDWRVTDRPAKRSKASFEPTASQEKGQQNVGGDGVICASHARK